MIKKVVSGGQTGADRGGLDAAIYAEVPHSGWCPKGRLAEDGVIPAKYHLKEMTSKDYLKRTEANVVDSDVTIIFSYGSPTGGSKHTAMLCEQHKKPCLPVNLSLHSENEAIGYVSAWLKELELNLDRDLFTANDETLVQLTVNIAGSRGSKGPDLQERVMRIIVNVLHDVNGHGPIMYPMGK